jgi:hypothetical protein
VSISDFARLASSFNLLGQWFNGDFTYDGIVNIADFSPLAANFNLSAESSARGVLPPIGNWSREIAMSRLSSAAVPEPVTTAVALLAGTTLARRRR